MLFQLEIDITGYSWVIGLALSFALAFAMMYLTYKDFETFLIYLVIFIGFSVYAGLLELWVLVLCLILDCVIMIFEYSKKRAIDT